MKSLLVVTADEGLMKRLLQVAPDYSVFSATSDDEVLDTLRLTTVDLVVKDVTPPLSDLPKLMAKSRQLSPGTVFICLCNLDEMGRNHDEVLEAADFVVRKPVVFQELSKIFREAQEKQQLQLEVSALRSAVPAREERTEPLERGEAPPQILDQVVKEFAKALSANFDREKILDLFLSAVGEMIRPSRAALLLLDPHKRIYRIAAHRGLAPWVVESLWFSLERGLPLWFLTHGRNLRAEEVAARPHDLEAREIQRELMTLQAVLAVPLFVRGGLTGILTLGQRISGTPYTHREGEILFNLASHLAIAVQDITLHHEVQYQKIFIEKILSHMQNGVAAIGTDEKINLFNHRAAEILRLEPSEVLHHDLRALPSPLGDMLYETLTKAKPTQRTEIQLALGKIPLEVSTYPILGEEGRPLGAVCVFEDLTDQKRLLAERRQAEQFQLLNRTIALITDELKNPLVSIHTFVSLLADRYDDPEFRHQFTAVVSRDMRHANQVFDKLSALVSEEHHTTIELIDMRSVVEECLKSLNAQAFPPIPDERTRLMQVHDEKGEREMIVAVYYQEGALTAKADRAQLVKALSYLVWYLIRKSPPNGKLSLSTGRHRDKASNEESVRIIAAVKEAVMTDAELEHIFDPLAVIKESLIDVGPSVSRRIVEAQGGRLTVKRTRDEVSFVLSLPLQSRGELSHA
jgi:signal transduction histidine kinase/DNA-binding response OmpR family regulator